MLSFTPAADANGQALVSVFLRDDGGTANGGDDTSPTRTFTITVDAGQRCAGCGSRLGLDGGGRGAVGG